jgi:hypothetical protein
MHSFYFNGVRTTKKEAFARWLASATYRNASKGTRNEIWGTALHGDASGNHNPHGEVDHLREAGIELR